MKHESKLLSTKQVMAYFGYSDPKGFGEFVKREAVPRIVVTARKIMFDPVAIADWVKSRSVGQTKRSPHLCA